MSDNHFDSTDLDETGEEAWRRYRIGLLRRIAGLDAGTALVIATEPQRHGPRARIIVVSTPARIRMRIHPAELYVDPGRFLRQIDTLTALGWSDGTGGEVIADADRRRLGDLTDLAVLTLREVCDIVFPTHLQTLPGDPRSATIRADRAA
ncbi:TY-Chap domain-containing protein [Gordonia sp. NPDC003376]